MARNIKNMIEGYTEVTKEIEILRKYGLDYTSKKEVWKEAVERLHPRRIKLRVSEKWKETDSASTLRLVPVDRYLPPFQAGQYINVMVEIDGVCTGRPYSISSPPNQIAFYDITVKRIPGGNGFVSDYLLDQVSVGDIIESTGPAGHFYYNPLFHGNDLVFIAGGSGITPFMSMIRETTDRGLDRRIHLIYGCPSPQDAIFHEELIVRSNRHRNLTYDLIISDPVPGYKGLTGLINAELINKLEIQVPNSTFYLCGPKAMYDYVIPELQKLGVLRRRIRLELYGTTSKASQDPAWPQEIASETMFEVRLSNGKVIPARASEPLLISMERAGILVENRCRSGECSMCRVKLISGRVFQPSGALVRKSDQKGGYIHCCAAYPLTDLVVDVMSGLSK